MNVKVITLYLQNSNIKYGGSYRRYMELIEGMLCRGWEVHHISPRGFSNINHRNLQHYGVYEIPFRPAYFPFTLQAVPQAIFITRKHKIDVLVAFTMFDAFIGIIARLFSPGIKVIMCDRGNPLAGLKLRLRERYGAGFLVPFIIPILSLFQRFVYRKADFVIFNSDARRRHMTGEAKLKPERVRLIYNNANPSWVLEKMEKASEEALKIRERWKGRKLVVFVGNLFIDGRDISSLLKAFKRVKEEMPQALLILVGEGPDKKEILRLRDSLSLQDDVVLEGWKDNPLSYMLASDILLVPALHEGFSNTILEALYCKALILGSRVGGTPEALKYEELLFTPKEEKGLATKVLELLKNEEAYLRAKELIKKRRQVFMFDWVEEMATTIKEVIK